MRIKKFCLGNHTIKVKYVKCLYDHASESEIFGRVNPKTNIIEIATVMGEEKLAEDVIEHSLHHELTHYILMLMGQWELNSNENFVDALGGFIAQFNKTKR
jgi:hypothetical protein